MTVTEYLDVASDQSVIAYVRELASALCPADKFGREYLRESALIRLSQLPGDIDRWTILRSAAEIMFQRSEARSPEVRRAKSIMVRYVTENSPKIV
jgi:hypothetical protein